jgi:hypothetical protein
MTTSRSVILRIKNVSDKQFGEKQNAHFIFSNFFSKIIPFYDTMWKNTVQPDRPQMIILHMRIACCIPQPTSTPLQYVTLNAFPPQQSLH